MDDNWGNILYIILMALFVIVGALKKKKKPLQDPESFAAERAEDEIPSSLDNIFDTLLGANDFTPEEKELYDVSQVDGVNVEPDFASEYIVDEEIESAEYDTPIVPVAEETEEEVEESEDTFDWRQAIISKEILDRKYI